MKHRKSTLEIYQTGGEVYVWIGDGTGAPSGVFDVGERPRDLRNFAKWLRKAASYVERAARRDGK